MELVEIDNVFCRLNVTKALEVAQRQLSGNLDAVQLQEVKL